MHNLSPTCDEEAGFLLGLFGPEVVQFFEMNGPSLTFFCTRTKKPGAEVKVRVMLVDYKVNRVDIPLKVVSTQPCGRGQLCVGTIEMSDEHLRQLEDLLYSYAVRANLAEEARRSPRLALGLKAMSRDIPGYNCVTIDFSRNGVLLNCHGPLEQGQLIQFNVDTEMHSLPSLSLQGRVIFCRENGRNRGYQVAIDLAGLSDEQQEALDYFLEAQTERMSGNLMQRQIGDAGSLITIPEQEEPSHSA